jgi:hypothetical protein
MAIFGADGKLVHWFGMTPKGVLELELYTIWVGGYCGHSTVFYILGFETFLFLIRVPFAIYNLQMCIQIIINKRNLHSYRSNLCHTYMLELFFIYLYKTNPNVGNEENWSLDQAELYFHILYTATVHQWTWSDNDYFTYNVALWVNTFYGPKNK